MRNVYLSHPSSCNFVNEVTETVLSSYDISGTDMYSNKIQSELECANDKRITENSSRPQVPGHRMQVF